jgi:hypothetical protein
MSNIITAGNATNNGTSISSDTSGVLELKTGSTPTTALTISTGQNVGIGTSSPNTALSVRRGAGADAYIDIAGNNNTLGSTSFTIGQASDNLSYIYQRANAALIFATNNAERARIDSSGNLLLNNTTGFGFAERLAVSGSIAAQQTYGPMYYSNENNTDNVGRSSFNFLRGGSAVGQIVTTNSTCSYLSISDHRLKENVAPMTGALAKVAALKPVTYKWKKDGTDGQGFIAHELQAVVPDCVSGEKDAVNEDGSIKPQGIDTSFLVATLTAAIQELKAELDATKAEVAALKGA